MANYRISTIYVRRKNGGWTLSLPDSAFFALKSMVNLELGSGWESDVPAETSAALKLQELLLDCYVEDTEGVRCAEYREPRRKPRRSVTAAPHARFISSKGS
jgi:hypothetical protein